MCASVCGRCAAARDFRALVILLLTLGIGANAAVLTWVEGLLLRSYRTDVDTDYLDEQAMCGLLPLTLGKISIPGIALTPLAFSVQQLGGPAPSLS